MQLRVLVVDDEPLARTLVRTLAERDPELVVVAESADGRAALDDIAVHRPDVVFLDVHMPGLDGIEVVERLATSATVPQIVFVTAHDEYAVRAFELHAVDYLVKPIDKARFCECVSHVKQTWKQGSLASLSERLLSLTAHYRDQSIGASSGIMVRKGERVSWLEPEAIVWVEAANQYVNVHTPTEAFVVSDTLTAFLKRVEHPKLVRVHRSAAINATNVERVVKRTNGTHDIHLSSGAVVPLSRSRRRLLPVLLRMASQHLDSYVDPS